MTNSVDRIVQTQYVAFSRSSGIITVRDPKSLMAASFFVLTVLFSGCGGKRPDVSSTPDPDVVVCDVRKVSDTISIPLSSIVESCNMVKLENTTEALVGNAWHTTITDDYIAVKSHEHVPVKLFGSDGRFIRDIGAIGRGPDEYSSLNGLQFSPEGDMLYLLPFATTDKILVFDLKGNHLEDIPLAYTQRKFKASFSKDSVITIFSMPFEADSAICFQQDYHGRVLRRVFVPDYLISQTFDGEVFSNLNDFNDFYNTATDTLYHYDTENNRIKPVFAKDFGSMENVVSWSNELPGYYYFYYYTYPDRTYSGNIAVNKETLESHYFRIENDFMGGIRMTNSFNNGWFIDNISAFALKSRIKEALKNNEMDESMRSRLTEMDESLGDEDNNVVFYGRLRK